MQRRRERSKEFNRLGGILFLHVRKDKLYCITRINVVGAGVATM
jgi:hypothetical protein